MASKEQIRLTLVRSPISCLPKHKLCVQGLGLRRMNHSVVLEKTPSVMGMVNKVSYLLKVEEI